MRHMHIWHFMTAQLATAVFIGGLQICREHYWSGTIWAVCCASLAATMIATMVTGIRFWEYLWGQDYEMRWHPAVILNIWGSAAILVTSFALLLLVLGTIDYWVIKWFCWVLPITPTQVGLVGAVTGIVAEHSLGR